MQKRLLIIGLTLLIILGTTATAPAHPHAFIAQRTRLIFDDKGLAGFKVSWAFDEMFSAMIAEDFDANHDGNLDPAEVAVIKEKAFGYISKDQYYIHVKIQGEPFAVKYIRDFDARLENGMLFYEFLVPCHVSAGPKGKQITISPYDPEYYSALYFIEKNPVVLENDQDYQVTSEIKEDKTTSIYYNMVHPYALFIDFRKLK